MIFQVRCASSRGRLFCFTKLAVETSLLGPDWKASGSGSMLQACRMQYAAQMGTGNTSGNQDRYRSCEQTKPFRSVQLHAKPPPPSCPRTWRTAWLKAKIPSTSIVRSCSFPESRATIRILYGNGTSSRVPLLIVVVLGTPTASGTTPHRLRHPSVTFLACHSSRATPACHSCVPLLRATPTCSTMPPPQMLQF